MKRTTVFADERLVEELKNLSAMEKRSFADVVREAMEEYAARKRKPAGRLSFIGAGGSGRADVAEKHEELLWKK